MTALIEWFSDLISEIAFGEKDWKQGDTSNPTSVTLVKKIGRAGD